MGEASVMQREDRYFLRPFNQAVTGVWVGSSPIDTLDQSASDTELGRSLVATLQHSKRGVPHPDPKNWAPKLLYKTAGVRSWKALVQGAICCFVSREDDHLRFLPAKNAGAREGFQDLIELEFSIPSTSSYEEIGQAVRRALKLAK